MQVIHDTQQPRLYPVFRQLKIIAAAQRAGKSFLHQVIGPGWIVRQPPGHAIERVYLRQGELLELLTAEAHGFL